jgi:hypothetical protein
MTGGPVTVSVSLSWIKDGENMKEGWISIVRDQTR